MAAGVLQDRQVTDETLEMFRDAASSPEAWRDKAATLRRSAEALWDSFFTVLNANPAQLLDKTEQAAVLHRAIERVHTSQLLYGLATETALKAQIIEDDPESIEFSEKRDGDGTVVDLVIQRIGVDLGGDGHDLVKLAEAAGMLGDCKVFSVESDHVAIREILAYLTDCVRWSGRYPAPKKMSDRYVPGAPIPSRILGHYMRDWLDPFLDALLADST